MIIIVSFLLFSTLIYPVVASTDTDDGNGDGSSNNDMGSSSPDTHGQGSQNSNQGNNNQNSENGEKNQGDEGNGNSNTDPGGNNDPGKQSDGNNTNQNQNKQQSRKGDTDGDTVDDQKEKYQYRTMTMTKEQNQTRIHSEWQQESKQDFFEIFFTTENGPKIFFDYIANLNSSTHDLSFDISFNRLIEYFDENYNGRFDENDTTLGSYSLVDANYTNITYELITSEDGESITKIHTRTNDSIFSIIMYVSGNYSQIQNQVISPSEIKIDFIISDYIFSTNDSYLSLETSLNTIHYVEIETETFDEQQGYGNNEHEINISSKDYNGFFSWLETAIIDNVTYGVNVTVISSIEQTITNDGKEILKTSTIYFCYPQGETIVHDPKIGVVSVSYNAFASTILQEVISSNNIFVYIGICMLASILFMGTVFIRKKM